MNQITGLQINAQNINFNRKKAQTNPSHKEIINKKECKLPAANMYAGHKYKITFGNNAKENSEQISEDEKLKKREQAFNDYFKSINTDSEKDKLIEYILNEVGIFNLHGIKDKETLMKNFPWDELKDVLPGVEGGFLSTVEIIKKYSQTQTEKDSGFEGLNELCKNYIINKNLVHTGVLIANWSKNANNFPWDKLEDRKIFEKIIYDEKGLAKLLENIKKDEVINEKSVLEMLNVLDDENFKEDILKKINNKEVEYAIETLISSGTMDTSTMADLITSGLTKEEYEQALCQLAKTLFRALKTPNQYLSNIPIEHTTKVDGKYPELSEEQLKIYQKNVVKFFKENYSKLIIASSCMDVDTINQMMDRRFDSFEAALDKSKELSNRNRLLLRRMLTGNLRQSGKPCNIAYTNEEKEEYIKKKEKQGKPLTKEQIKELYSQKQRVMTTKEKIQLSQVLEIYQKAKLDTDIIEDMIKKGEVDIQKLKNEITKNIFKKAGITDEELKNIPEERLKFNEEYSYLLLTAKKTSDINIKELESMAVESADLTVNLLKNMEKAEIEEMIELIKSNNYNAVMGETAQKIYLDMLQNIDKYTDKELKEKAIKMNRAALEGFSNSDEINTIIKNSTTRDFKEFILDTDNEYGVANKNTENIFKENGINYAEWLNPTISKNEITVKNAKCKIRIWERNPQEDLFIGNKTTCCTRIGEINSSATTGSLLNTSYNTVELLNDKDKTVGMSRIFFANIEDKPAIIMDNFELNNTFIKNMTDEEKNQIRDSFFDYLKTYAEKLTGNKATKIYMSGNFVDANNSDLKKVELRPNFIGDIAGEGFYVNSINCNNPKEMNKMTAEFYEAS